VPIWKISKNGYLPPDPGAGGVGSDTSRPSNGREVANLFPGPPEGLFANKKFFLFAKRPLPRLQRHPARPTGGRCLAMPISHFLFEFMFYKLFKIYTFLNTRFIRHTLLYTYKIFSSILRRRLRYLKLV
jgi:hypothetical protein